MSNLQSALDAFKRGDLIIVTDHADRENEGDLMMLAEKLALKRSRLWCATQLEFYVLHSHKSVRANCVCR